ncbi:MAG: hypothetical protein N5P05_004295 (plasmid) [Chroococcopsis gigantea SAG 12.99]|jgi:hypothetical protein|nr:hypothetical protein [Chroococcopsis gigantea SAG 12.99]
MVKKRGFFTITAIFAIMFQGAMSSTEEYGRYCNERFGFCFDYPKNIKREPPPANGDGITFIGTDGLEITGSGINNFFDDTLDSEKETTAPNFERITYQARCRNWFVLSGYQRQNIIYWKTYLGKGSINHLFIRYPKTLKQKYDPLVNRVSLSFKPGNLTESH